jgi:hypothetical protein
MIIMIGWSIHIAGSVVRGTRENACCPLKLRRAPVAMALAPIALVLARAPARTQWGAFAVERDWPHLEARAAG